MIIPPTYIQVHPPIASQMKINLLFNNISINNNTLSVICKHKSKGIFMQLHKLWLEFKHTFVVTVSIIEMGKKKMQMNSH